MIKSVGIKNDRIIIAYPPLSVEEDVMIGKFYVKGKEFLLENPIPAEKGDTVQPTFELRFGG